MQALSRCPLLSSMLLVALSLALFVRGFLLTRLELPHRSACADTSALPAPAHGAPCWSPQLYDRVVLLVIDAWRHDFAAPAAPSAPSCQGVHSQHCNRMPLLARTLQARPRHARLYRAQADAPTVTMQRVKALGTGGLPTFVDIGSSFGSGRVEEDNWLAQAAASGALHLLGDDTWEALFPRVWTRAGPNASASAPRHAPFSTFDTKDLHSGDAQLAAHLLPALQALSAAPSAPSPPAAAAPWRVLLAHAPGVDHVGHTHHANHPAMAHKLGEMDALIHGCIAALDAAQGRTLLVVVGDHGMTEDGNHGGSTAEEAGAALLAVSFGRPLLAAKEAASAASASSVALTVSQVDLVPSLSLALGLPIPYNSLGRAFFDWEWGGSDGKGASSSAAHAALLAAFGHARFMASYAQAAEGAGGSGSFSALAAGFSQRFASLLARYRAVEASASSAHSNDSDTEAAWQALAQALHDFSGEVAAACRAQWVQFSQGHMLLGLLGLVLALAFTLWHGLGGGSQARKGALGPCADADAVKDRRPPPLPLLTYALPLLATAACTAHVWAQFTDTYISAEPSLILALQGMLVLPMGLAASNALFSSSPLSSRKLASALPTLYALVYMACACATAAPPIGWMHAAFLRHRGSGALPAAPPQALGAGAAAPILLPVDASDPALQSYLGASLPALLLLAAAPAAASFALHSAVTSVGAFAASGSSQEAALRVHLHARITHPRYRPVHACTVAALLCLYFHWHSTLYFPTGAWPAGWCSASASICASLPTPRSALPSAVLILTALAQILHALCAPALAAARLTGALRLTPAHLPLVRLFSVQGSVALMTSTLLPCAALLLGPWSPPILLLLYIQAQCLVLLVLTGTGGVRGLHLPHCQHLFFPVPYPTAPPATPSPSPTPPRCSPAALLPWPLPTLLLPHLHLLPLHSTAALCMVFGVHAWGATGHCAQFSALAYNSGFLLQDAFEVRSAGVLLAANTFGVSHGLVSGALLLWPVAQALAFHGGAEGSEGGGAQRAQSAWAR